MGHKGGQDFARIGWGGSRAQWVLSLYDSPYSSALGFPASLWLPSLGTHSWSTYGLLKGCLPPARPRRCPLEMVAAWECGWGPLGRWLLDRSLSVELLGSFPGPRPMTGCLRMLPIIRLTEHKGATLGLSRPDAWDGCTGALGPHHRGQGHTGVERAALTRRNENHFLQPHRRQRQRKTTRGSSPQARAGHPS